MRIIREWVHRLWGTLRHGRPDADLEEELRTHLELAAEDAQRRSDPEGAVRKSRIVLGGAAQALDALRDQRGIAWLDDFRRDVGYAVRALFRARGFAATTILTLALGIGANTTIFSLIDALVLRQLPVPDPEQLVILTDPAAGGAAGGLILGERDHVSFGEFQALRAAMASGGMGAFSGMFAAQAWTTTSSARVGGQAGEDIRTKLVSGEYFAVLGVPAVLGRTFTAGDEKGPGSAPYAVISHSYWQRRFSGAPSVLGARIRIADADLTIIGVASAGFTGEAVGEAPDAWVPYVMQPQLTPGLDWLGRSNIMWLHAVGRLNRGVRLAQAQAEADIVFGRMLRELSATFTNNPGIAANVLQQHLTLRDASRGISTLRGEYTAPLYILMGFVVLVLVIACASVATLLLARGTARAKELDIRAAIGASCFRILRQLLTESLVLSMVAGVAGSAIAFAGTRLLVALVLGDETNAGQAVILADLGIWPDLRTLLFTFALCLLTVVAFGLAPAISGARLRAGGGAIASSARMTEVSRRRSSYALVAVQVALSVMLLIGAGWFVRTLRNLEAADLGYSRRIVQMNVSFRDGGYERAQLGVVYESLRNRLAALPGVKSVTYSTAGLFGDDYLPIAIEGSPRPGGVAKVTSVSPGYFTGIEIPIVRGREIEPRDSGSPTPACVINEALASRYFADANPVGRYLVQGTTRCEIVGVAGNARDMKTFSVSFADYLRGDVEPVHYRAAGRCTQCPANIAYQLVTVGDPAAAVPAARAAIQSFNRGLSLTTAWTVDERVRALVRQERIVAQLASAVGGAALLLACIALYGLLSQIVTRRTNEIGIRMALGARPGSIAAMILRDVAVLVLIGLAIGVPASLASARLVRSQVFGLGAADSQTLVVVIGVIVSSPSRLTLVGRLLPAQEWSCASRSSRRARSSES